MKKRSTRESSVFTTSFHRYITCSIPVSGWRATSSRWRATSKKTREKQSEVQVRTPRSSGSSRDAFLTICFAKKAERMISPFLKLLENGQESEKTINMKKFRIFRSLSTVYYSPNSDKGCRNYSENTFLAIFKIDLKP